MTKPEGRSTAQAPATVGNVNEFPVFVNKTKVNLLSKFSLHLAFKLSESFYLVRQSVSVNAKQIVRDYCGQCVEGRKLMKTVKLDEK
jgi:hypothetical protein